MAGSANAASLHVALVKSLSAYFFFLNLTKECMILGLDRFEEQTLNRYFRIMVCFAPIC